MPRMNERYRKFVNKIRDPAEARRRIVECARRHGTGSAARWSGAGVSTVRMLVRRADEGRPVLNDPGPPIMGADRQRIIAAKMAHPEEGGDLLKRNRRVPYSRQTIFRVLGEAGLLRKRFRPTRDPDHWLDRSDLALEMAEAELMIAEIARSMGVSGWVSQVERIRRRVEVAKRRVKWWREQKAKRDKREGERSPRNAIITSAVPGALAPLSAAAQAGDVGLTPRVREVKV